MYCFFSDAGYNRAMHTLAIANHKGGVGKTATTHALGEILAHEHHLRVLLIDLDPQSSLTISCGIDDAAGRCIAEVLGAERPGKTPLTAIVQDLGRGLWLVPSDLSLGSNALRMISRVGRELALARVLPTIADRFDLAILDCPPNLDVLTQNALAAAQGVIVPTQCSKVDLRGVQSLLEALEQMRVLNPGLRLLGVLPTFFDARLTYHAQALEALQHDGVPLLDVRIGRSVRVAEAAAIGTSVVDYTPDNPQTENYRLLAKVVMKWLKSLPA